MHATLVLSLATTNFAKNLAENRGAGCSREIKKKRNTVNKRGVFFLRRGESSVSILAFKKKEEKWHWEEALERRQKTKVEEISKRGRRKTLDKKRRD